MTTTHPDVGKRLAVTKLGHRREGTVYAVETWLGVISTYWLKDDDGETIRADRRSHMTTIEELSDEADPLRDLQKLYHQDRTNDLKDAIADLFPDLAMTDRFWTDPLEWTVPELMEEVAP